MSSLVPTLRRELEAKSDRLKGALILVVAADHNDWFRMLAPALFDPLTFHVFGFLFLTFTFGSKQWGIRFVADRVARYLVPYWWALTAASAAYWVLYRNPGSLKEVAFDWVLAAVIGNAPFVKASSGLLMLWFLPALFGLACVVAFYDGQLNERQRKFAAVVAVLAHLFLPLVPKEALFWLPFGLGIAANIFLLGLLWRLLTEAKLSAFWGPTGCGVFLASYTLLVLRPSHLEIATLDFFGINNGLWLVLQDLAGIAGVLALLWLVGLLRSAKWIEAIGRKSLLVYLFHPVAYVVLGKAWSAFGLAPTSAMLLMQGCVTLSVAVLLSYALAHAIYGSRLLSRWIVPREWGQWAPVGAIANFRY